MPGRPNSKHKQACVFTAAERRQRCLRWTLESPRWAMTIGLPGGPGGAGLCRRTEKQGQQTQCAGIFSWRGIVSGAGSGGKCSAAPSGLVVLCGNNHQGLTPLATYLVPFQGTLAGVPIVKSLGRKEKGYRPLAHWVRKVAMRNAIEETGNVDTRNGRREGSASTISTREDGRSRSLGRLDAALWGGPLRFRGDGNRGHSLA